MLLSLVIVTIIRIVPKGVRRVSPQRAQARVYLVSIFCLRQQCSPLPRSEHILESSQTRMVTEIVSKPRARNRSADDRL